MLYDNFVVTKHTLKRRGLLLQIIAVITIWATLPAVVLIHCTIAIYQKIYFSIFDIPKVRFRDYFVIDRQKLKKLKRTQKCGCMYCGYANAVAPWITAVGNRTEVYSCAIKHSVHKEGQGHQKEFFDYEDFR